MLERCYSSKYKITRPTYTGVEVCAEWRLFSNFLVWFNNNYTKGYQLDKDILVKGNKKYSPETCIFVPSNINNFLILSNNSSGVLPLGVDAQNSKYRAKINNGRGVVKYLGTFNTKEEAHRAWQKAKLERAIAFNFPPLQRVIDQLTYDIENNLETKTL